MDLQLIYIYYKMLSSDYSNKKIYIAALAINEFACLCVPDFGIATEPGLDLKL